MKDTVRVEEGEYHDLCQIEVDETTLCCVGDCSECPEDANLNRDLNFVYSIPDALKKAYDAGVRGEGFEIVNLDSME